MGLKKILAKLGMVSVLATSNPSFAQDDIGKGIYTFKFGDETVKVRHLSSFKEPYLPSERSLLVSQEKKDPTKNEYRLGLTRQDVPVSGTETSLDGKILTEKDVQFLAIDLDEKDAENGKVRREFFSPREVVPSGYFDGGYIILGVIKEDNPSELFNFQPVYKVFASTARQGGKSLEEMANRVEEIGIVVAEHAKQPEPEVRIVERVVERVVEKVVEKPVIQYVEREVTKPQEDTIFVVGQLGYSPINLELSLPSGSISYKGSEFNAKLSFLLNKGRFIGGPFLQFRRSEFDGNSKINNTLTTVVKDDPISLINGVGENNLEGGIETVTRLWDLNKLYASLGLIYRNENLIGKCQAVRYNGNGEIVSSMSYHCAPIEGVDTGSYGIRASTDLALIDIFNSGMFGIGIDSGVSLQVTPNNNRRNQNIDYHTFIGPTLLVGRNNNFKFVLSPGVSYHSQMAEENDQRKEFVNGRGMASFSYRGVFPFEANLYGEKSLKRDTPKYIAGINTTFRNFGLTFELRDTEIDLGRKDKFNEQEYLLMLTGQTNFVDPRLVQRRDTTFPNLR